MNQDDADLQDLEDLAAQFATMSDEEIIRIAIVRGDYNNQCSLLV